MGPKGIVLINSPITTFQQSLTHSAMNGIHMKEGFLSNQSSALKANLTGKISHYRPIYI